jgi:hypothetical protein
MTRTSAPKRRWLHCHDTPQLFVPEILSKYRAFLCIIFSWHSGLLRRSLMRESISHRPCLRIFPRMPNRMKWDQGHLAMSICAADRTSGETKRWS